MAERRRPDADVQQELQRRLEEIELLSRQAHEQGLAFSAPTEEQLEQKIKRETSNSPHIYAMSWSSSAPPGASAFYQVWISNPDATSYYPMFVSLFFGVANFLDDLGSGIAGRDQRWPYLSSPPFSLTASGTGTQSFNYTTPASAPRSTYLGNAVVWRGELHDKGAYVDRGLFYINLI